MTDILTNIDPSVEPSFSLKNRILRVFWCLVSGTLFSFSPTFLYGWRSFLLRCFGAKVGKGCHVYPKARIWAPWSLEIHDLACIANDVTCSTMAKITIGRKAVLSQGASLYTGSHDYEDPKFQLYAKPINIGADAWIAAEAFICPGVNIGEGAVIGARSVVTHDMPAWTVCAGNPCKPIKPRKLHGA